jgi:RHS repeat-associated protein
VEQRWTSSVGVTDDFVYGYDRNGNALYRANQLNHNFDELYHASGAGQGYDNFNEIIAFARGVLSASVPGGPLDTVANPTTLESWRLNAVGGMSSVTVNGATQNRSYNAQNQATTVGNATLTYDKAGNVTADQTGQQLVYDAWGRLVKVLSASGAVLAAYAYDGLGRRIQETASGITTDLYYDQQGNVLEEDVGGVAKAQYVYSPADGSLIERDRDATGNGQLSERLYAQTDANGDVTALVNAAGQVVERYVYDPYGTVTVLDANWNQRAGSQYAWRYLFQGGRYDSATGYYHFGARDYSPSLGSWLEQDPLGLGAGDPNVYRFVGGNPVNATDPSGLSSWFEPIFRAICGVYDSPAERRRERRINAEANARYRQYLNGESTLLLPQGVNVYQELWRQAAADLYPSTYGNLQVAESANPPSDPVREFLMPGGGFDTVVMALGGFAGSGPLEIRELPGGRLELRLAEGPAARQGPPRPARAQAVAREGGGLGIAPPPGHVIFGELDQLGRPTGVRATITQEMLGTGSDAAQRIRPPGFGGQAAGHARGHLLGNQPGGSGRDPRNLVTLFQNPANTPVMRDFENQVAAAVRGGQTVDYWAIPVYQGSNPIPVGVTLRARGSGGFSLDVSIINRGR